VEAGEDPFDAGGYFIINGTERILILLEDLAPNTIFVQEKGVGPATHIAQLFSESGTYRIPHLIERYKDGLFSLSFTSLKRIPLIIMLKALGLAKDKDILGAIGLDYMHEDIYINLYEFLNIKSATEAIEFIAKTLKLAQMQEQRLQRVEYLLDNLLLPHVGTKKRDRALKAYFLGRMVKKLLLLKEGKIKEDDKDHYMNKRVRLSGDLLETLFRVNLKALVSDMLYIFQRGVRRGKLLPISSIIRTKLLTSRVKSAIATGNWTSNRQGVSQRLDRENGLATISHLQRVVSLLATAQENFKARELHPTHWGRLCPIETPEGKNIGLRKNLALLTEITPQLTDEEVETNLKALEPLGLKRILS